MRRMRRVRVAIPTYCNDADFKSLNPDAILIAEHDGDEDKVMAHRVYDINTRYVAKYIWNITCKSDADEAICHFIVKNSNICNAIAHVESKIDLDVWRVISAVQVKSEDSDIVFTDYPVM